MTVSNSDELGKAAMDWRVTAYAFGELEGDELNNFESRLSTDETLRQAVDEFKELAKQLEGLSGDAIGLEQANRSSIEPNWEDAISTPGEPALVSKRGKHLGWVVGFLTAAASLIGLLGWQQFQSRGRSVSEMALKAGSQVTYEDAQITYEESRDEGGLANDSEESDSFDLAEMPSPNSMPIPRSETLRGESPQGGLNQNAKDSIDFTQVPSSNSPGYRLAEGTEASQRFGNQESLSGETRGGASQGVSGLSTVAGEEKSALGADDSTRLQPRFSLEGVAESEGRVIAEQTSGVRGLLELQKQPRDESENLLRKELYFAEGMLGEGAGAGDRFESTIDNPFFEVAQAPLSTFSIDVDTASYSKIRSMLTQFRRLPTKDAVRIEEMINYFSYDYPEPAQDDVPFSVAMEIADCPWAEGHQLARIAIKGRSIEKEVRAASNLVFLIDVSGSMDQPNKLPLVRRGLEMLARQLGENDRVAIVVYAGAAGVVLESTTADNKDAILNALDRLSAGGSTHGSQGIQLAYEIAREHFIEGGTNRVILCTDGDFNVGTTGTEQLVSLVENEAKGGVFLSVLGFGTGNLNDAMLEAISGRGNGNYAFIDSVNEARKVLVEQMTGTLLTIAKNVKIQVEFNPTHVQSYRLIGYENRVLAAKDFNDDKKDAGEIGAGHTVTALYELVPRGYDTNGVDPLRYQPEVSQADTTDTLAHQDEVLMLKLRYVKPEESESRLLQFPIGNKAAAFSDASEDFRFAAAVASFGMLLRDSPYKGSGSFESVRRIARDAVGADAQGLRDEFVGLVEQAIQITR